MDPGLDSPTLVTVVVALLGGVALASACGLRAFLPLTALSLAARAGLVHLTDKAAWIAGDGALWVLAVATLLEMAGDKVPILDHLLDVAGTVVRPAAAAVAGWALFGTVDPTLSAIAALILGSGALGIHLLKAKTRLGSTALTMGHANPLLSIGEDVSAALLSAAAFLAPLLGALLLAGLVTWAIAGRRRRPH
jgi:hypothetical protein